MLTVDEVAERLGISRATVYRLLERGDVRAYKIGKSLRFKEDELEAFVDAHRVSPKKQAGQKPAKGGEQDG